MNLFINLIRNVKLLKTDKSYTKIETMFYLWVPTSWIFIFKDLEGQSLIGHLQI